MTPAESERHFDDLMRRKLAEDGALEAPPAHVWPAVSQTLPAAAPRSWGRGLLQFLGGLLVGILLWWGGGMIRPDAFPVGKQEVSVVNANGENHQSDDTRLTAHDTPLSAHDMPLSADDTQLTPHDSHLAAHDSHLTPHDSQLTAHDSQLTPHDSHLTVHDSQLTPHDSQLTVHDSHLTAGVTVSAAPDTLRPAQTTREAAPLLWVRALTLDTTIRRARLHLPLDTARLRPLVAEQARTISALVAALDSAKIALNPLPVAPSVVVIQPDSVAAKTDSAVAAPVSSRWAVALLAETTTPWGTLPTAPAPDPTVDTRETLRSATTRGLHLEHRLRGNDRWLLRAGFGDTRLNSQFAAASDRMQRTTVNHDTVVTHTELTIRRDSSFIIHLDSVIRLNPRINGAGQIIGYDTLWQARNDTLYQVVVTRGTIQRTENIQTTRIETHRERREQQLRPTYRFWTIPMAAQYDLLRWRRWRAGLSVGAQIVVFRGGEAPVAVGDGYALRHLGVREGPFRPVSVSVSTALELRYALTDRLSVFGGGGVRGWAIDPLRTGTTPRTLLGSGQVGVSWGLGGK